MPNVEEVLQIYRKIARPWLDKIFEPATCTEQSRVLLEVLKRFGIAAEPVGTKMIVTCQAQEYQFVTGIDEEEKERARRTAKAYIERHAKGETVRVIRHVVLLVERRILVDSTLHQASARSFKFQIEPDIVILPFPQQLGSEHLFDAQAKAETRDGIEFEIRWIATDDRDWEQDDGWEPSHLWPLIDRIESDMRLVTGTDRPSPTAQT
jgi:hypothetical protein